MKNVKDFQTRYERWKNGERYWDIRGVDLPKYDGADKEVSIPELDLSKLTLDDRLKYLASAAIMQAGRTKGAKWNPYNVAQDTYLLDRDTQSRAFQAAGYRRVYPKNYGLVSRAVGGRTLPIWQRAADAANREDLNVLYNAYNFSLIDPKNALVHAGKYPSAIYYDADGNLFANSWDLNDYGGESNGKAYSAYTPIMKIEADAIDKIGSPTVVTTGIQPIVNQEHNPITLENILTPKNYPVLISEQGTELLRNVQRFLATKGLQATPEGVSLPEVTITAPAPKDPLWKGSNANYVFQKNEYDRSQFLKDAQYRASQVRINRSIRSIHKQHEEK